MSDSCNCKNCNANIEKNSNFCDQCGIDLRSGRRASVAPSVQIGTTTLTKAVAVKLREVWDRARGMNRHDRRAIESQTGVKIPPAVRVDL